MQFSRKFKDLTINHARYLACANNEGGKARIEDKQASKLLVRKYIIYSKKYMKEKYISL